MHDYRQTSYNLYGLLHAAAASFKKCLKTESETSNKLIQTLLFCLSDFKLAAKTCCVQKKKKIKTDTPVAMGNRRSGKNRAKDSLSK